MTDVIEEEITLDDLDVYWAENGLPIFVANRSDICDIVESMGFSIYYLLGNASKTASSTTTDPKTKATTTKSTTTNNMQLFKVVNNFVGRSVSFANEPFAQDVVSIEEQALYTMPAIPHVIIDKLDQFFRLVDAQHGTESIVMLTYDTTKEGPEGWGVLVPDQVNTSVHCNYDPDSVAQIKPDNVLIVGSVHSHPGMPAYASGTDHKDQADFDGIHITFGWQKSTNNGATQYHIELQMSGKAYTLKPEDVFEDYFVDKSPDPEVVEWSEKVKKVLPPSMGGTQVAMYPHPLPTGAQTHTVNTGSGKTSGYNPRPTKEQKEYGFEEVRRQFQNSSAFDIEDRALIVAEIANYKGYGEAACPSCATTLDDFNFFNGYCDFCYIPIAEKNMPIDKIISNLSYYCSDVFADTDVPVYLWTIEDNGTQALMKIVETTLHDAIQKQYDEEDYKVDTEIIDITSKNNDYYVNDDRNYTYCCSSKIEENGDCACNCPVSITPALTLEFDSITRYINFYQRDTKCSGCEYFYDPGCPGYMDYLTEYAEDKSIDITKWENTLNDEDCQMYEPYSRESTLGGWGYYE